jgi:hypothetical protein
LEDGLVTFLTDGINEAESLSEALKNLAVDFLKTMQQFFAKQAVTGLMNQWFPVKTGEGEHASTLNLAPPDFYLPIVNAINNQTAQLTGRPATTSTSITATTQTYPGTQGNWLGQSGLGAFSSGWQNSSLNQNRQYSFNMNDYGLSSLANSAQISATNIDLLGSKSTEAGNSLVESIAGANVQAQESQRTTTIAQVVTSETELANLITTMVIPAFDFLKTSVSNLDIAIQTLTSSLNSMGGAGGAGMATGGLIKGPGTSKSDDIPTMLSNGEYVIKASSVKKYGTNFLNALNEGKLSRIKSRIPHFADGGLIKNIAQDGTARGVSSFGKNMASNISNTTNFSVALVRDEVEAQKQLLKSPEGQKIMLDFSRKYAKFTSTL